jgi:hypothetical protein
MEAILTNINLAGNLTGCCVADNQGHIVTKEMARQGPELESMITPLVQLMGSIEAQGGKPTALDLDYQEGKAFLRNFDWGVLVMLGGARTNLALLNLLLNVAVPKLTRRMNTPEFTGMPKITL